MDHLDTRQLAYFVEAARAGSMSRAAAAQGVSEQALSKAVARLESALGARLFARGASGVELTDFGRYLLPRAERILAALEATERSLEDYQAARRRPVLLGVSPACSTGMGGSVSPSLVTDLREKCPEAEFEIIECPPRLIEERLLDRTLDFGLGAACGEDARFERVRLGDFPLGAVGSAGCAAVARGRVRPADLAGLEVVVPEDDDVLAGIIGSLCKEEGVKARVSPLRMEVPDPADLVVDDLTIVVRPMSAIGRTLRREGFSAVPLQDAQGAPVSAPLWLCWRKTLTLARAERALVEVVGRLYSQGLAAPRSRVA